MYKSFRNKRIKVNGRRAEPDARLCAGDVIELYINDEFFPARPAAKKPAPRRQPPVTAVYEDDSIAVLYKPRASFVPQRPHRRRQPGGRLWRRSWKPRASTTQKPKTALPPPSATGWTGGTEGLVIAAKSYAALRDMNAIIRRTC